MGGLDYRVKKTNTYENKIALANTNSCQFHFNYEQQAFVMSLFSYSDGTVIFEFLYSPLCFL